LVRLLLALGAKAWVQLPRCRFFARMMVDNIWKDELTDLSQIFGSGLLAGPLLNLINAHDGVA
jgi:hypothetical protein